MINVIRNCAIVCVLVLLSGSVFARAQQEQIADLEDRVSKMERLVDNKVMFDILQKVDALQQEVQLLRDQSERNAHELETLKKRQKDLYLGTDRRLQRLETGGAVPESDASSGVLIDDTSSTLRDDESSASAPQSSGGAVSAPVENTATSASASGGASQHESEYEAYNKSFTLIKNGEYQQSIDSLQSFLATYPASKYSANAQYWLAEAHYVLKEYDIAAVNFRKVIDKYPASSKVSDAMLKLGYTYYELKQWQDARNSLKLTTVRFPGSDEATKAQERLDRMAQEGH